VQTRRWGHTCFITGVGSVVGRAVIERETSRESNSSLQTILLDQCSRSIFNQLGDLNHCHSRFNRLSGICPHLFVDLSSMTKIVKITLPRFIKRLLLCRRDSPSIPAVIQHFISHKRARTHPCTPGFLQGDKFQTGRIWRRGRLVAMFVLLILLRLRSSSSPPPPPSSSFLAFSSFSLQALPFRLLRALVFPLRRRTLRLSLCRPWLGR